MGGNERHAPLRCSHCGVRRSNDTSLGRHVGEVPSSPSCPPAFSFATWVCHVPRYGGQSGPSSTLSINPQHSNLDFDPLGPRFRRFFCIDVDASRDRLRICFLLLPDSSPGESLDHEKKIKTNIFSKCKSCKNNS